ncbi:MAG TPA: hypothetical protein PLV32_06715, partial [Chitinophagaceae bacterium]|nr:hypothetical protein [Chitinophagaceae bacterium]
MKTLLLIVFGVCSIQICIGQEIPATAEQQLENLADAEEGETEDDSWLQQLELFKSNPLNLNTAEMQELRDLRILTDLQIANLILYRRIFGKIIHIYELQAIPTWDIQTIRKLLPFISIESPISVREDIADWFVGGTHGLLLRVSQLLEKQKGFKKNSNRSAYAGSPQRVFFRYRYNYKNNLQFGIVGDKDAGEQFFKGIQRMGFDFYSFHLFARNAGIVKAFALGDFTVNLGQGLIQWQSLAFKKSAEVMGVKRQSATLRPYHSAGEYNFNRGIGITIRKRNLEATAFTSLRNLSANFNTDAANQDEYVSSILMSGLHRTETENSNRNRLRQISFGGNMKWLGNSWQLGINSVYYHFSLPISKRDEPYNLFSIRGRSWYNLSVDYSYTYRNLHLFGETAVDKNLSKAFLHGILLSVDPSVDISIVHRAIPMKYQAVNANAFTENSYPNNENGIYAGISVRPQTSWRIDLYGDLYKFPWLRFQADAPGSGKEFLVQFTYTPNRQTEIYTRFRTEAKQVNTTEIGHALNVLAAIPRQNWRIHASYKIGQAITLRNRVETVWYNKKEKYLAEQGFLIFIDVIYKPLMKRFSGLM